MMESDQTSHVQWPQQLMQPITHSMMGPSLHATPEQITCLPQEDTLRNIIPLGTVKTEPADSDYEHTSQVRILSGLKHWLK